MDIIVLIIMIITIIASWFLTQRQINAMMQIEDDKTTIAIQSLIQELEYNRNIIHEYIDHSEKGANLGKEGGYSWDWNVPHFGAFERYFIIACKGDKELAIKIEAIYSKLEACKTIVYYIHHLLASSSLEKYVITQGGELLMKEVTAYNYHLNNISKDIQNSFKEPLQRLCNNIENKKKRAGSIFRINVCY